MTPDDWRRIAELVEKASTLAGYNGSCSSVVDTAKFTRLLRAEAEKQEKAPDQSCSRDDLPLCPHCFPQEKP